MQDSCRPFLTALQPQTHNTSQSPTSNPKGSTYLFRRYDWAFLAPTSILSNHESPSPFVPYVRPISLTFTHPLSLSVSLFPKRTANPLRSSPRPLPPPFSARLAMSRLCALRRARCRPWRRVPTVGRAPPPAPARPPSAPLHRTDRYREVWTRNPGLNE